MISNEEINPLAILQALGIDDTTAFTLVQGGSDTAIWRIERADEVYALRVFQQGEDEDCEREQVVMLAARNAGLPVPQVHARGNWHGYPALLLSWIAGRPLAHELRARPWQAWKLGVMFGRMHAAIHTVTAPDLLLQQPDEWIGWAGPDEQRLQACLRTTDHQVNALLHLDYHPLNVMTDGSKITGILDWRNAHAGEPRADAARTVSIIQIDYQGRPSFIDLAIRKVFEWGWRTGYKQQAGPLGDMRLFYAWAGTVMERDLAMKRGSEDLARIHRWTMKWKQRAHCC